MGKTFGIFIAVMLVLSPLALGQDVVSEEPAAAKPTDAVLTTSKQRVSYAIGLNIGTSIKRDRLDLDSDILVKGLKDALSGAQPLLAPEEIQMVMMEFQKEMVARQQAEQAERQKAAGGNKAAGEAFLAENSRKDGVVTLENGLQYEVLTEGFGEKPAAADTVTVNYRGTLIDGTEFDSSYARGEPATFPVGGVITGWTQALQLMPVGSKWRLCIPSDLAYAERGAGARIGPNATLVFEVELLSIEKAAE